MGVWAGCTELILSSPTVPPSAVARYASSISLSVCRWVAGVLLKLSNVMNEAYCYACLSTCAHRPPVIDEMQLFLTVAGHKWGPATFQGVVWSK